MGIRVTLSKGHGHSGGEVRNEEKDNGEQNGL